MKNGNKKQSPRSFSNSYNRGRDPGGEASGFGGFFDDRKKNPGEKKKISSA